MRLVPALARTSIFAGAVVFTAISASSASAQVEEFPVPVITSVTPASGPATGGNVIVVKGDGLAGVWFASVGAVGATIIGNTNTELTLIVPARSPGLGSVSATTIGGTTADTPADDYLFLGDGTPTPTPR